MDGSMDGWMDGWVGGWMDGWMDGWVEGGREGGREGGMDGWMGMWTDESCMNATPLGLLSKTEQIAAFVHRLSEYLFRNSIQGTSTYVFL